MWKSSEKIQKGVLVWITGLPGAGKTTLGKEILKKIKNYYPTVFIDGDAVRKIIGDKLNVHRNL